MRKKHDSAIGFRRALQAGELRRVLAILFVLMFCAWVTGQAQTFSVIHHFSGGADGGEPNAGLVMDAAGNLYGTALYGGTTNDPCRGYCGVVFKLKFQGGS